MDHRARQLTADDAPTVPIPRVAADFAPGARSPVPADDTPTVRIRRGDRARGRRRRRLELVGGGLSVLLIAASGLTITLAWAGMNAGPNSAAARYLPAEGLRWATIRSNGQTVAAQSRLTVAGAAAAASLSWNAGASAIEPITTSGGARITVTSIGSHGLGASPTGSDGHTFHEVLAATDSGIGLVTIDGGGFDLAASPIIPVLPADPRPGARWSADTTLSSVGQAVLTAHIDFMLSDGGRFGDGCMVSDERWKLTAYPGGGYDGATFPDTNAQIVWCRGVGPFEIPPNGGTFEFTDAASARAAVDGLPPLQPANPDSLIQPGTRSMWFRTLGSTTTASLAVVSSPSAGPVVIESDRSRSGLLGVAAATGQEMFLIPGPAPVYATPAAHHGDAIAADTAGNVTATEVRTGFIRWRTTVHGVARRVAVTTQDRVAVLTSAGRLLLLNADTGALIASIDGNGTGVGLANDGPEVIAVFSGSIIRVSGTGSITQTWNPAAEPTTDPAVVDSSPLPATLRPAGSTTAIVVGAVDGSLLALDPRGPGQRRLTIFRVGSVDGVAGSSTGVAAFSRQAHQLATMSGGDSPSVKPADLYTLAAIDGPPANDARWLATTESTVELLSATGAPVTSVPLGTESGTTPLEAGPVLVGSTLWTSTSHGLTVTTGVLG